MAARYRAQPAWAPWAFLAPFLVASAIFTLWPLAKAVPLAFQQTFGPRTTAWIGFENFAFLFGDPLFWRAVSNTAIYAACSITIILPASLGLAMLLNRPGLKGRAFFRLIFFAPSLVGLVFVGLMFALMFEKRTGLINTLLAGVLPGWDPDFPWLDSYVMPALVVASVWLHTGFNMVYFLAALQNVPAELIEAASVDGANPWQKFWHITLPEISPIASFVVMLTTIGSLQLFELPFVLLNGPGPDNSGLTIVMYLYNTGFVTGDLGYASAIGWVLAAVLMSVAAVQRWYTLRSER